MKENDNEEEWDLQMSYATEDFIKLIASYVTESNDDATTLILVNDKINYNGNWIVDSSYSNHMTRVKDKLSNMSKYKGRQMVVTVNNSRSLISYVSQTVIMP